MPGDRYRNSDLKSHAMAFGRKRVFANAFGRKSTGVFKKRRTVRRRVRRGQKFTSYTTKSGAGRTFGFKAKRISKRRWNNMLWNSTLQKNHYRSEGVLRSIVATPVTNINMVTGIVEALDNGTAPFWTTAGGLQVQNAGVTPPLFTDSNIILRGGKTGISISNPSTGTSIAYSVWLIKSADRFSSTNIPALATVGWDPSVIPEFKNDVGFIRRSFTGLLEPGTLFTAEHRLPVQKIDQVEWATLQKRWYWMVAIRDVDNAAQQNIDILSYFNVSFSGDAVGTT